jgi:hypothetical protein
VPSEAPSASPSIRAACAARWIFRCQSVHDAP